MLVSDSGGTTSDETCSTFRRHQMLQTFSVTMQRYSKDAGLRRRRQPKSRVWKLEVLVKKVKARSKLPLLTKHPKEDSLELGWRLWASNGRLHVRMGTVCFNFGHVG